MMSSSITRGESINVMNKVLRILVEHIKRKQFNQIQLKISTHSILLNSSALFVEYSWINPYK